MLKILKYTFYKRKTLCTLKRGFRNIAIMYMDELKLCREITKVGKSFFLANVLKLGNLVTMHQKYFIIK